MHAYHSATAQGRDNQGKWISLKGIFPSLLMRFRHTQATASTPRGPRKKPVRRTQNLHAWRAWEGRQG
jgi:hypothetical protein